MTEALEFTSAKKRRDPIPFTLDGDEYEFTPPKNSFLALRVIDDDPGDSYIKLTMDWLGEGLPKAQVNRLMKKLRDPKDDLDVEDVEKVAEKLLETVSGRPTT